MSRPNHRRPEDGVGWYRVNGLEKSGIYGVETLDKVLHFLRGLPTLFFFSFERKLSIAGRDLTRGAI